MSKTDKKSTSKPAPAKPQKPVEKPDPLADAEKLITAALNQMHGLQSFLKGLGEADAHGGVAEIDDLCFGFSYLLQGTWDSAERARALIIQARKGGGV